MLGAQILHDSLPAGAGGPSNSTSLSPWEGGVITGPLEEWGYEGVKA